MAARLKQKTVNEFFTNEDDFIRDLTCLRAEKRIGWAVLVPAGLIHGVFGARRFRLDLFCGL